MHLNEKVKTALLSVSDKVYLFTAAGDQVPPYIVYGVDGDNNLWAGSSIVETCDSGYIDLFTRSAKDPLIQSIPAALSGAEISFYLNSTQYEEQTGLLHYEWRWEAV